jgi:hypothetical protein
MALKLKATAKAAKFEYADGRMTVSWDVDASLTDDELVDELRRIVTFYDAQTGKEPLPERIPGMALGMAQTQYPAPDLPPGVPAYGVQPTVGNGWAALAQEAPPELPERLQGEVELIPPEEQG